MHGVPLEADENEAAREQTAAQKHDREDEERSQIRHGVFPRSPAAWQFEAIEGTG